MGDPMTRVSILLTLLLTGVPARGQDAAAKIDAVFERHWQAAKVVPAPPAASRPPRGPLLFSTTRPPTSARS
jgi:hypothetical protein